MSLANFSRRELPCLIAVLRELPPVEILIVDGYVWLDAQGRPGLGAHLYEALERKVKVIGVAKTQFCEAMMARQIFRGKSARPLFITAGWNGTGAAASAIASMHGPYRIARAVDSRLGVAHCMTWASEKRNFLDCLNSGQLFYLSE